MSIGTAAERAEAILSARRAKINLIRQPLLTTALFGRLVVRKSAQALVDTLRHPTFRYAVLPLIAIASFISFVVVETKADRLFRELDVDTDGILTATELRRGFQNTPFAENTALDRAAFAVLLQTTEEAIHDTISTVMDHGAWREVEYLLADAIWWLVLGILSSVGLGSGMHSGLLFLFPHIYLTCIAADKCGSVNFWTYPTNIFYGPRERAFHCISGEESTETVSLWLRVLKVVPWCIIWGAGTAIGEIPPYALSYAAALQGKKQDELEEVSQFDILNRMKNWMLDKIQKYGFWAILLLAAWPNMAFDLCGMACGQFLTPFWVFFGATFVGKALIKVNMQAVFFVALFSGDNIERLLDFVFKGIEQAIPAELVVKGLEKGLSIVKKTRLDIAQRALGQAGGSEDPEAGIAAKLMGYIVVAAVAWFAKSIVDTFAQSQQEEYDVTRLEALSARLASNLTDEEIEALLDEEKSAEDGCATFMTWYLALPLVGVFAAITYDVSLRIWAIGFGVLCFALWVRTPTSPSCIATLLTVTLTAHCFFAAKELSWI